MLTVLFLLGAGEFKLEENAVVLSPGWEIAEPFAGEAFSWSAIGPRAFWSSWRKEADGVFSTFTWGFRFGIAEIPEIADNCWFCNVSSVYSLLGVEVLGISGNGVNCWPDTRGDAGLPGGSILDIKKGLWLFVNLLVALAVATRFFFLVLRSSSESESSISAGTALRLLTETLFRFTPTMLFLDVFFLSGYRGISFWGILFWLVSYLATALMIWSR